ncbi:membrane protein [Bradyrhizobium nitroreducens]|uniref:Membrane protein n=1 Tax=Bradyrhizobium nitroreducens TaxID=709803 RepID=A0A2M6U7F7_9BRAD|nr:DoxX family protein [Bradyrhizobium nitroreducens]PIT00451.1 membrane protein [Bradyrhizobium nitroreducens]
MIISPDDFRIKADNFDPTKMENIVRIACGAFYFPHAASKFIGLGVLNPPIVKFFAAAGMSPPEAWVYLAAAAEISIGIALTLGICTRFAALGSVALMAVAVYSLQVVKGFGWTWNTGGYEYPVFWGICSLGVAVHAWKTWASARKHAVEVGGRAVRMAPAE